MGLSRGDLVYLVAGVVHMYTLYLYIKLFVEEKVRNKKENIIFYIISYIAICIVCIGVRIPVVTVIINLIVIYCLTLFYNIRFQKRILAVINIYAMQIISEMIVVALLGKLDYSPVTGSDYRSIFIIILSRVLCLTSVGILHIFPNIKKEYQLPLKYSIGLFVIPASSLYLMYLIAVSGFTRMQAFLGLLTIIIIDFFSFYIYDMINQLYDEKVEKVLLDERNKYYAKRLLTMKDSVESVRKLQHDWKSHLIELGILIQQDQKEKALDYLKSVNAAIYSVKSFVNTGNLDIDGIINYKLQEADQVGIKVSFDANVPASINISPFDCAVVLGNLLDNAIEATKKDTGNRIINGQLRFTKGNLLLLLENSYSGTIQCKKNEFITSKEDKKNHGIGLKNIGKIVEKYSGNLHISYDKNLFRVEVLLYLG